MNAPATIVPGRDLVTRGGVAYRKAGSGFPLVLFHGNSGSWRHWIRNIGALAGTRTVFALDLPGFGNSIDVGQDISVDGYYDLVANAVLELCQGEQRVDCLGFSFGGQMAAATAVRLGTRMRRLALVAPGGFEPPVGRELGLPRRSDFGPSDEERREFHRQVLLAIMLAEPASADMTAVAIQAENSARSRLKARTISFSGRMPALLADVRCPIQLIVGERDRMPFPSIAARLEACRKVRPDIRVDLVPGAGHWVQYERSAEVNRLLLEFLAGPERPGSNPLASGTTQ